MTGIELCVALNQKDGVGRSILSTKLLALYNLHGCILVRSHCIINAFG